LSDTYENDAGASELTPRADRRSIDNRNVPAQSSREPDDTLNGRDDRQERRRGKSRWPLIILIAVVVIAVIAGVLYWLDTAGVETTDDAYTEGNAVSVAPEISGYVSQLNVNDNTYVKAGQLLLTIDPRQYKAALDQAKANLELAQYQLASAQVDLDMTRVRAPATLQQAQAQLVQAQANRDQAEREYHRQHAVSPQATTQSSIDQANTALASQTAAVSSANAQVQTASLVDQTIKAAEDTVGERQAQLRQAQASLDQAAVNFSYTEIRAPADGWITQRNVDTGTFVQAGQQVFYIVTTQPWIVANFKETQLAGMRPGQKVSVSIDAYPTQHLSGHVDSIQAGSGARFSAFPAENATGNFVKIVRRVPVKIIIDSGLDSAHEMPLGLSVEPTVTIR
jgi:membrane fusion protein (multidrug efflux system)